MTELLDVRSAVQAADPGFYDDLDPFDDATAGTDLSLAGAR